MTRRRGRIELSRWGVVEDPLRQRSEALTTRTISVERAARLVEQADFRGRPAAFALRPPDVIFHSATLPEAVRAAPPAERQTMLRFEAARQVQTDPEALEVDCWPLPPGNRTGANTMIVAARREALERWVAFFQEVGLELSRIDVLPCALLRSAWRAGLPKEASQPRGDEATQRESPSGSAPQSPSGSAGHRLAAPAPAEPHQCLWGVLDVGFSGSLLAVALGNQCVYVRGLATGGDAFTSALVDALRVDYGTAETLKRRYAQPGPRTAEPPGASDTEGPGPSPAAAPASQLARPAEATGQHELAEIRGLVDTVLRSRVRSLAADIERAFAYAMESYPEAVPVGLYLCGGGAKLGRLSEDLQELLGIAVARLNPCADVVMPARGLPVQEGQQAHLAGCIGLALGDLPETGN